MTERDALIVECYDRARRKLLHVWRGSMQVQAVNDALGEALCRWLRRGVDTSKHPRSHAHWLGMHASDLLKEQRYRRKAVRKASRHVRMNIETSGHHLQVDVRQEDYVIEWLDRHVLEPMPHRPEPEKPATWHEALAVLRSAKWSHAKIGALCSASEEAARQWTRGSYDPSPARQLIIERAASDLLRSRSAVGS